MRPIRKLLIANRGEIARRVIRTARRMGIATVAVYSDADAQALHVREADERVALHGHASSETYLRIDKLLDAATRTGADAVHPGYGFLSENAAFAQAVAEAGLAWVGPPAEAIRQLGNKSSAKRLALARGVPCLPGFQGDTGDDEALAREACRIGFPLMVKAAAGGGGRGMRLVADEAALGEALQGARSEALSAFGSGELLLERALLAPRHVEVQVFADMHGHCIHLGERDCSVQRRHQKIIEESPSPAVDAALRERMGRCAIELAQAAGYVGAGTVEFLLEGGEFFLMEMNTRLQVEHPVTEMVTGLDLVEWQLRVARGEALPLKQDQVRFDGHAIEVRLCAEDERFTPHAGTVKAFVPPDEAPGLRFDHALFEGLVVPPYYDSMVGKLVAHAPTREAAIERLAAALDATKLLGLPTNRAFLSACLRHAVFRAGDALIPFLAQHGDELRAQLAGQERAIAPGVAKALFDPPAAALACAFPRPVRFRHRGELSSPSGPAASADTVRLRGHQWHAQVAGVDLFLEDASFDPPAGTAAASGNEVRSPFNGKVLAIKVQPGAAVRRGDTLVVLESMKLEHSLAAPRDGVVQAVHASAGQQAGPSQLLVTLEAAA